MAVKDSTPAGVHPHAQEMEFNVPKSATDTALGGETIVTRLQPSSQPGPAIHNKPTNISLYASRDLEAAGLIPAMHDLINEAFINSHSRSGAMSADALRLRSHQQLVGELSGPGTFTYVITYTETKTVIGVASAKCYKTSGSRQPPRIEDPKSAFIRTGASEPNTEGWELSSMAISPSLQRQGLAGLLMGLVEAEVTRRFLLARDEGERSGVGLVMLLSTVKEINWDFYSRRHYEADYETFHGPGWHGSAEGFTVVHMSKRIAV